ncbi:PepSY domain-containing protein [Microbacterium sp. SA39]|uniref:PepSY domain-containing protein n=1 Tax=Microbacterium sp. SA39 TaxID=1263625 RepID=UPI0005F9CEF4|nr:PepSY domain-containing protein [Microbacterium sp. SA39]KJQ52795.1 hypothetical protein RS85_03689 [Microbacterium sp. SA39]
MDDKTPTPDQTPDQPTTPVTPTADAAARDAAPAEQPMAAPAASAPGEAKPRRKRALLIGGGIAAAVVLLGGGVAVGAAIADELGEDDDHPSMSDGSHQDDDRNDSAQDDRADDDARGDSSNAATGIGSDSADELIEIAQAARGAADGEVTSIDAKRDGAWEVQLTTDAGDETEVRVDDQLAATVVATEAAEGDDTGSASALDDDAIRSLVEAALAEADGMITDLDVDSDDVTPYDASVLTSDNRSIDISFTPEFAVVGTDTDE